MANTKVGRILSRLMQDKGLTSSDLSRIIDLPQPTIYRISTGTIANPHISSLEPIAKYFGITTEQLKGLEPIPEIDKIFKVPLLDWNEILDYLSSGRGGGEEYTITDIKASVNTFAIRVKDSSMEPIFPKGTLLLVDPNKAPKDRSYVIVFIHSIQEAVFRQLIIDTKNVYIKPLSPDLEQFKLAKLNDIDKVLGIVVQSKHIYEG